jgi:hypothetical protein
MELERLGLVLGIVMAGVIAGGREQLLKLDLFPALIAVFLLGFGSDRIKDENSLWLFWPAALIRECEDFLVGRAQISDVVIRNCVAGRLRVGEQTSIAAPKSIRQCRSEGVTAGARH